jgi:hypothetical protein
MKRKRAVSDVEAARWVLTVIGLLLVEVSLQLGQHVEVTQRGTGCHVVDDRSLGALLASAGAA